MIIRVMKYSCCVMIGLLSGCRQDAKQPAAPSVEPTASESAVSADTTATTKKSILFFGNSLTAGYGIEPTQAFPALIQQRLDSLGLPYRVVNAGLSGETSAGGKSRIDWLLRQKVDIFVLELGGNDGLRGIATQETRRNLQAIIDQVQAKYPVAKIILAGMQIPPNLGQQYATEFRGIYRVLAEKNRAVLIPFLLEGVGGIPRLNLPDGIHPTPEGHRILAENVWKVLQDLVAQPPSSAVDTLQPTG